jgi:hypothetical protein
LIRDAARASCSWLRLLAANAAAAVELLDHDAAGNGSIEHGVLGDILLVRLGQHDGRLRRVSSVAVRPGEGPLTKLTAGVQPAQVLMTHLRHCSPTARIARGH